MQGSLTLLTMIYIFAAIKYYVCLVCRLYFGHKVLFILKVKM
jgi:hypothetical protein